MANTKAVPLTPHPTLPLPFSSLLPPHTTTTVQTQKHNTTPRTLYGLQLDAIGADVIPRGRGGCVIGRRDLVF
jgi:hypothetical protein